MEEKTQIETNEKQLELWNPNAASWWGLIFSTVFSSYLIHKNWQTLGKEKEAKVALYWLIGSFVAYLIIPFTEYTGSWALVICVVWFIGCGRKQYNYVKNDLQDKYKRKPWGKALLGGVGVAAVLIVINLGVILAVGSYSGDIEITAQEIMNEKILPDVRRYAGNQNIECVDVQLGEEFAPDNYYALGILNDGSKVKLTVQVKDDQVIVQVR